MVKEIKKEYKQPLSVYFVYHPKDKTTIKECLDFCYNSLQRDSNKPYSRSINIPVFLNTSLDENIPCELKSRSVKTIAFILINKYTITDEAWNEYYIKLCNKKDLCTILIAIDETALNFEYCKEFNVLRAYQFDREYYKEEFLLNVAHEIYRWILAKDCTTPDKNQETSIKIFLSHTKKDELGEKIAKKIKAFIDNTRLGCFFDTTDIPLASDFCKKIKNNIKDSTLLVIHSDPYSSRYWCQKEILSAKEINRPIIAIDCLNEYDDRRFPHASNVAAVHLEMDNSLVLSDKKLYQIILATLLETLRFHYTELLLKNYKQTKFIDDNSIILSRPPEFCDVSKIISYKDENYESNHKSFCYPEPFIYDLELDFFENLGIKSYTPISYYMGNYENLSIGLSISDPTEDEFIKCGQSNKHLIQLSQDIARYLLTSKATLVYGGDLRKGGFTDFIFNEALILQNKLQKDIPHIKNYLAYPIYLKDDEEIINWKAKYKKVAKMIKVELPNDIKGEYKDCKTFLFPNSTHNKYLWCRSLTSMRKIMIDDCNVRICAGGKHSGYSGCMPGVLEEIIIAAYKNKPLYLLGGFGGVVYDVCEIIKNRTVPQKLTKEWQVKNNAGYEDLLNYLGENKQDNDFYNKLTDILNFKILNNGLTQKENNKLFETPFVDEAIYLIMKGLKQIKSNTKIRKGEYYGNH